MSNIAQYRKALISRIVDGDGRAEQNLRKAAFEGRGPEAAGGLLDKVTKHAYRVTDDIVRILRVLHGAQEWPENLHG